MWVSLSKILTPSLIQMYLLKRWIYYRCFERRSPENIQAFVTDVFCKICEFFRIPILKNKRGELVINISN